MYWVGSSISEKKVTPNVPLLALHYSSTRYRGGDYIIYRLYVVCFVCEKIVAEVNDGMYWNSL